MHEIKKVVIGKDEVIAKTLLAIISKGHILIEDIPGVGKTTLALAFSKALSLNYHRMQFTPDVLPTDVTGFTIFNKNTGNFDYKPGVVMCNLFLADEVNRTSSKTQSALLEVMEESKVTVDGITRELPNPFIVIATQNPIGSIGTQMLPESQLDRFTVKLSMGYPDINSEINIIKSKQNNNPMSQINSIISIDDILYMQYLADCVYIDDKIYLYIARLVEATRNHPLIKLGVSPRGTIALTSMAKSSALMRGRDFVIPDDVTFIFKDVVEHRILLNSKARINDVTVQSMLSEIINNIPVPEISI
ncbi:MAG: MoxR family ATPase [Clostridiales bacterium]|nr:MoxR family ATPase [Clostridiales bacterium]